MAQTKTSAPKVTAAQTKDLKTIQTPEVQKVIKDAPTKSAAIRQLHSMGLTRGQIAKAMGIRYQHVRNVLITPLKRGPQGPQGS